MYSNVQQHDSSVCATAVPSMMSSEIDASKERVFDGFEVTRVLSESDRLKSMTLLGGCGKSGSQTFQHNIDRLFSIRDADSTLQVA